MQYAQIMMKDNKNKTIVDRPARNYFVCKFRIAVGVSLLFVSRVHFCLVHICNRSTIENARLHAIL